MQQQTQSNLSQPTVAQNVSVEIERLRTHMTRMIEDLRTKTKGASAEAKHTLDVLDGEVKRFTRDVAEAAEDTHDDLRKAGQDLRIRIQKLANQVALPS